ncbi:MAG: PHP domain-containing protein [Ignavibacteria bacterium]|nr:PHP domain-containing protein [Ignavibacteria bacterium]
MPAKIDLHSHTKFSDGYFTPQELLEKVSEKNISVLAITDHDTVDAIPSATSLGNNLGITIIPGVELSSQDGERDLHILGYFVDIEDEKFKKYLSLFKSERIKRAERIIKKLNNLGFEITIEDVLSLSETSVVGRPHIADTLVKLGIVKSFYEAFQKFLGNNAPAYEKKYYVSPQNVIKIIHDAGGIAIIAHPGALPEETIGNLIKDDIDGFEIYHPAHSSEQMKYYEGITNNYFLYGTGGSDFHGGTRSDANNIGRFYTPAGTFESMKRKSLERYTANF